MGRLNESVIQLCLTQPSYEEAFHFLEMKSAGFKLTPRAHEMIVQRCYEAFDPSWKVAPTEMEGSWVDLAIISKERSRIKQEQRFKTGWRCGNTSIAIADKDSL